MRGMTDQKRQSLLEDRRVLYGSQASPECQAMLRLLEADIERLRTELETCAPNEVERRQGELKEARRMVTYITEADFAQRT